METAFGGHEWRFCANNLVSGFRLATAETDFKAPFPPRAAPGAAKAPLIAISHFVL
jgi:hypothetical protein